jgi:signal transduction histidine kinase
MSIPPARRLSSVPVLLGLAGLLLVGTAAALLFLPGPHSPLPFLGLAGAAGAAALAIRQVLARARDTEQALDEGERYIEAVADLSQDIHAILEVRTRSFLYLNPAVANLLGYPAEAFTLGGLRFLAARVHPEDLPLLQRQFEDLVAAPAAAPASGTAEPVLERVLRVQDQRGIYRWLRNRMAVFVRDPGGRPMELLAVVHDVTGQRATESALAQAHQDQGRRALADGLLRDLGETLAGLRGDAELARSGAFREALERVQAGADRASALCRQMAEAAGDGPMQMVRRRLNDAVRESLPAIESMIPSGGRLRLDLDEDLPEVAADQGQVRYALLNLVYNAAEAIRPAGGEITIRTRAWRPDPAGAQGLEGSHVCLEVRDSGPGKPPEVVERIYDPGFAARWPGHGLGLATVQGIMSQHRGRVRTVSVPGSGDTTQVFFPVAGEAPATAAVE